MPPAVVICPIRSSFRALWAVPIALAILLAAPDAIAKRSAKHAPRTHQVAPGHTLSAIAARYGVSVKALCRVNGIDERRPIHPGQRLVIPGESESSRSKKARKPAAKAKKSSRKAKPSSRKAKKPKKTSRGKKSKRSKKKTKRYEAPVGRKYWRKEHRLGRISLVGQLASWEGYAVFSEGELSPAALRGFRKVMISRRTGATHDIDPRLIRILVQTSDYFGGRKIRVVSGFRPKTVNHYTPKSRHSEGKAIDFSVEGIDNDVLRDYLRKTFRRIGVGYYPNSTHVHLDVRRRSSYWVDYSRPGERPRYARPDGTDPAAPTAQKRGHGGKARKTHRPSRSATRKSSRKRNR